MTDRNVAIVPAPRELTLTGGAWEARAPITDAIRQIDDQLAAAAYRITVRPDGATLTGGSEEGLRYAEAAFGQLVRSAAQESSDGTSRSIPTVEIADEPAYEWRGAMLDVARHFMPTEFILRLIDVLAWHRMNRLHLHLTDDQGWRVPIDAYPRLVEVGAWRSRTLVGHARKLKDGGEPTYDGRRHGGFYTKYELRHIVQYAADRGIMVIPEIDLPGHMQAAIAAYPDLGNSGTPVNVRDFWGISEDILNVSDDAITFAQNVVREVMEIFPGPYVHLGGDECPTTQWQQSPAAQNRMAELGLSDERQLQGWFMTQVAAVLEESGRRLIGWDEVLETDPPKNAVIMPWRDPAYGVTAAKAGYDVVMAPLQSTYFDYYQADPNTEPLAIGGLTTLADALNLNPIPDGLSAEEQGRIIGAQCQLWTEYVPDPAQAGYMMFPRLSAFAERAWGSPQTSYDDFVSRLAPTLGYLDDLGVSYRPLS